MTQAQQPEAPAAIKTLQSLGYTYHGAEQWKPPIGKAPDFNLIGRLHARIAALEAENAALKAAHAAAPVVLPEQWGVSVGGRIWVGNTPAHVHKLAEQEGLTVQKLYTGQQLRAVLAKANAAGAVPAEDADDCFELWWADQMPNATQVEAHTAWAERRAARAAQGEA